MNASLQGVRSDGQLIGGVEVVLLFNGTVQHAAVPDHKETAVAEVGRVQDGLFGG